MTTFPRALLLLALAHALVDAFAGFVQPLWPDLQRSLGLGTGSIQWAYVLWGLATSVSQLGFGYWGDRRPGGWLLWAGPLVGLVCLSLVGLVPNLAGLSVLLILGGLGIAAFHPEAAALAGATTPQQRSQAMSVFAVGGYLGQAAGPIYSGVVTTHFGLKALIWSVAWGLPLLAVLIVGLRRSGDGAAASPAVSATPGVALADLLRGRRRAVAMLLAIGSLRVLPVLSVPLALSYLLKGRGNSNDFIGLLQAVFMGGVGAGSLGCALLARHGNERRMLWRFPLVVAPLVWLYPFLPAQALGPCILVGGFLLGTTLPILVGYGQRLMPEGQRVASSITMGVTWGVGNVLVALLTSLAGRLDAPELPFSLSALACVGSSILCLWLPNAADEPEPVEAKLQTAS